MSTIEWKSCKRHGNFATGIVVVVSSGDGATRRSVRRHYNFPQSEQEKNRLRVDEGVNVEINWLWFENEVAHMHMRKPIWAVQMGSPRNERKKSTWVSGSQSTTRGQDKDMFKRVNNDKTAPFACFRLVENAHTMMMTRWWWFSVTYCPIVRCHARRMDLTATAAAASNRWDRCEYCKWRCRTEFRLLWLFIHEAHSKFLRRQMECKCALCV